MPVPPNATLQSRQLNVNSMLMFERWFDGEGAYSRSTAYLILSGASARVKWRRYSINTGRLAVQPGQSYRLLIDGAELARAEPSAASSAMQEFAVDVSSLSEGWHWLDIQGAAGDTGVPFAAYVMHGSQPVPQPMVPVTTGSFAHKFHTNGLHHWGLVPGQFAPTRIPLPARRVVPFADAPSDRAQFVKTEIAPVRWPADMNRPNISTGTAAHPGLTAGLLTTGDLQYYFKHNFFGKLPRVVCLDGPRGMATASWLTHIELGVPLPDGTTRGNIYCADPWSIFKLDKAGRKTTLAGYRHAMLGAHFADTNPRLELVGDWSAVPPERRGFHELWRFDWDSRTLATAGPAIPNDGNGNQPEDPHATGPVMFAADTQNNRVCRLEFDPRSHAAPCKITEFITGLRDPWAVRYHSGSLYVSERLGHCIKEFDATTGALIRTVLQGPALSSVSASRQPTRLATLPVIRTHDIVGPEDIEIQADADGVWLYFGSWAMSQIRRVNLSTGQVQVCVPELFLDGNALFVKIAISDGTFGPRGSLFSVTWSAANAGFSNALPEGWRRIGATSWERWDYYRGNEGAEHGLPWPNRMNGYPTAVAAGHGRLLWSGAHDGLAMLTRRLPEDARLDGRYAAGRAKWISAGYYLTHGHHGWGFFGLPLPWGVDPDIDYYLRAQGHTES
jgi:hypothetical protein